MQSRQQKQQQPLPLIRKLRKSQTDRRLSSEQQVMASGQSLQHKISSDTAAPAMMVALPDWHPPYEQPLQLEYGCHFDGSVKTRDAYEPDSPECDRSEKHMMVEFSEWMRSTEDVDASLNYVRALTGLAQFEGAKTTPAYFAVTMYAKPDYSILRSKVLELARVHYPELGEPIIRFYRGFYDVDL